MSIKAGGLATASEFAFTDWTPDMVDSGGAVAYGAGAVREGWYTNVNGLVTCHMYVVFGTTPAIASDVQVTLPVAADVGGIQACLGSWLYRDTSTIKHYSGTLGIWAAGATSASFAGGWSGTVPNERIDNNFPFVVAVGDILSATMTYRAA